MIGRPQPPAMFGSQLTTLLRKFMIRIFSKLVGLYDVNTEPKLNWMYFKDAMIAYLF